MTIVPPTASRITVDGKFFRSGEAKFYVKGVTYGPFAPNERGEFFAEPERTRRDFELIRELGANVVRVYYPPPRWLLDLALEFSLRVFVDVPWPKHLCFLDSARLRREARQTVREAVRAGEDHPAVFACSVVNEIPADIVRWSGVRPVERFIDELVAAAKDEDPQVLCTFTSFPPTEFLHPVSVDFVTFNVYLHHRVAFESYMARLQTLAGPRPLVLGEFGMDSIREGEEKKSEFLSWQIEAAFRSGLAGTVVFSFTDDWYRGGLAIEDWAFGLTDRDRTEKDSFDAVRRQYREAPRFPLPAVPKVSVVVASYNGAATLRACLESLEALHYPDYEIILVDDGSTDGTREIARGHPAVRYLHHENRGLSVARNTGIAAARGEIVAFTDSDCRADSDWLHYMVQDLLRGEWAAMGGHNFLPPDDSPVAAAVMASPGGPAHVMLTDCDAEHVPGCNMAFFKWALEAIGGFDPNFRKAGDDVDVCWRLHEAGLKIGFSHAGFVWHYRRSTVKAYLKQQSGYGEAEALLARKHPEYFNFSGGSIWRGRIYATGRNGVILSRPIIYHGVFGSGFFQRLYAEDPNLLLMLATSLGYHGCINLPLLMVSIYLPWFWPLFLASVGISLGLCVAAACQARLPREKRRFWSRPLIGCLFFLQPIARGWARLAVRLNLRSLAGIESPTRVPAPDTSMTLDSDREILAYWTKAGIDRYGFLARLIETIKARTWPLRLDSGWGGFDVEISAGQWSRMRLVTVTEELEQGKRVIKCRCKSAWSARAWLLFAALSMAVAGAIAILGSFLPWVWISLVLPTLALWFLDEENASWKQALMETLDEAARQGDWMRVEA